MGINIQLRSETGEILAELDDADMALSRAAAQGAFSRTRLLKYLVPWGDAVYNQAQALDLSDDIRDVLGSHAHPALTARLERTRTLVERLGGDLRVYLWFVGD